jgi:ABC-type branched-subunit amino acid transport system permease subunit
MVRVAGTGSVLGAILGLVIVTGLRAWLGAG